MAMELEVMTAKLEASQAKLDAMGATVAALEGQSEIMERLVRTERERGAMDGAVHLVDPRDGWGREPLEGRPATKHEECAPMPTSPPTKNPGCAFGWG